MGRIAVTDGMAPEAVAMLEESGHQVVTKHYSPVELNDGALSGFDAVVVRSATKMTSEVIDASCSQGGNLSFIGRAGVGVDNIDLGSATKYGVVVCNTPGASTKSVVELTIGHLLACARFIPKADRTMRRSEWAKKTLKGSELGGKCLGLIGYGRIAQGVGTLAQSFGMEVHAYDPYVSEKLASNLGCNLHDNVDSLFKQCTHISVHCNLSDETKHLVNLDRISIMPGIGADGTPCGNHIVNCARGGIVDEESVLIALESGMLTSAALDVFEVEPAIGNPLLKHEGFHGSPHIGAATMEAQSRVGLEMVDNLLTHFDGEKPNSALN
ncbi:MAG: hydroxyacid dehydrogenase [Candidatus Thermoplasmatota archaeon]|nr:hydroxyacid dehydrogenase [Candidatus Thermoplasmatota archaeon]